MSDLRKTQGHLIAGRYRLERQLGEGGMGEVWAATHLLTRRSVAMKFVKADKQHEPAMRQRLIREAAAVSSIRHPNIVEVLDLFDLEDGTPVLVMELLEGETLASRLEREERLSVEETASLLLPVISAVRRAHAGGIVHRDLKPENIFLSTKAGQLKVKVLDFGIAKLTAEHSAPLESAPTQLTHAGTILGTPAYMAPEQITNQDLDHRADIWSLGVILYECLAGTRPIEGQTTAEVIARVMTSCITPLDTLARGLPTRLTALVERMLRRDLNRRLNDLSEIESALTAEVASRATLLSAPAIALNVVRPITAAPKPALGFAAWGAALAFLVVIASNRVAPVAPLSRAPTLAAQGPFVAPPQPQQPAAARVTPAAVPSQSLRRAHRSARVNHELDRREAMLFAGRK